MIFSFFWSADACKLKFANCNFSIKRCEVRISALIPLLLPLLLLQSCSSTEKWDANKAVNQIFAPDELQFRRFEAGMTRTQFDAAYTGNAIYGNEMEVIDSLTVAEDMYCETAFRFDKENILREISVQIVIDDEKKKEELLDAIRKKMVADYGEGIIDRDQFYWRAEGGITTTDIFLSDLSSGSVPGKETKFVIVLYFTVGTMLG